jgi:hypothetical protein
MEPVWKRFVQGRILQGGLALLALIAPLSGIGATRYVDVNSVSPVSPYTNWATAANVLQDAIDSAAAGDLILVTNGVYASGGRFGRGIGLTNRVVLDRAVTLQSVNGPLVTIIQGYQVPGTTNGPGAIRCAYLTNGAVLSGFTLTNGATLGSTAVDPKTTQPGGGTYCESTACVVSNCIYTGNSAFFWGGGADGGTLNNCVIVGNTASEAGGANFAMLNNCLVISNRASLWGGGVSRGTSRNCTIAGNSAPTSGGFDGQSDGVLDNCILYYNSATNGPNYTRGAAYNGCCTTPLAGTGTTNPPMFMDIAAGDFRLQPNSRCINAGLNAYAPGGVDLELKARISGGTVDIGAYEYAGQGTGTFAAWLQQYQLATNGSADFIDSDADGHNNWQEWQAGTVPTNSQSALQIVSCTTGSNGPAVSWQSVTGRVYCIQRSTNPAPPWLFITIQSNVPATTTNTVFTDANVPASLSPIFYRICLQ